MGSGTVQHHEHQRVQVIDPDGAKRLIRSQAQRRHLHRRCQGRDWRNTAFLRRHHSRCRRRKSAPAAAALSCGDQAHHADPRRKERNRPLEDIEEGETVRMEEERKGAAKESSSSSSTRRTPSRVTSSADDGRFRLPLLSRQGPHRGQRRPAHRGRASPRPPAQGGRRHHGHHRRSAPRHEIFESPQAQGSSVLAEISGTIELRSDKRRGKMTSTSGSEAGMETRAPRSAGQGASGSRRRFRRGRRSRSSAGRSSRTDILRIKGRRLFISTCSPRCRTSTVPRA